MVKRCCVVLRIESRPFRRADTVLDHWAIPSTWFLYFQDNTLILELLCSIKHLNWKKIEFYKRKRSFSQAGMAHTFNPSTWRQRQADLCEFEVSLVYRVSSRTVRDTQRNAVSKQTNKQRIWGQLWVVAHTTGRFLLVQRQTGVPGELRQSFETLSQKDKQ